MKKTGRKANLAQARKLTTLRDSFWILTNEVAGLDKKSAKSLV